MSAKRPRALLFRVVDNALYVANFGRRFDRPGVISICRENLSAKTNRGPSDMLDHVPDRTLVDTIRKKALSVYELDKDRLQEDANHEDETRRDYAGRSLWELLQNADDALASKNTSSADLIGAKGLGFKSVLEISDRPSVHSGLLDFGFDAALSEPLLARIHPNPPRLTFRLPHRVKRDEQVSSLLQEGYATVVRLPFRSKKVRDEIVRRLGDLDPHFLLLCRHLDTVDIERPGLECVRLSVSRQRGARLRNSPATLTRAVGSTFWSTEWRIWSSLKPAPDESEKSLSAAIVIPVLNGVPAPSDAEIPVHVFFPTTESIEARFLVHGSFALTSNRNSIRTDQHDHLVRAELDTLIRQVLADIPAASAVRVFSDIVRNAVSRARRPDRLIQQTIALAVTSSSFVPVLGGGSERPDNVRTWEHGLDIITPAKLAREKTLAAPELASVFADLRSVYGAQPLRPADYADLLSRMRAVTREGALRSLDVAYAGCLVHTQQITVLGVLAQAQIWPTEDGGFRALEGKRSFLLERPDVWPEWLPADVLHMDARTLLEKSDPTKWRPLLQGRMLRRAEDWVRGALVPILGKWTSDDWASNGFQALKLIETWALIPDFGESHAFVERPDDRSLRALLAKVAHAPTQRRWVRTIESYAGRDLGAPPELAAYFKAVPDRHIVGVPTKAVQEFGSKRWKALLRWLGVSWEPKVQFVPKDGWLSGHPSWSPFRRALNDGNICYVSQEWFIEHFPAALEKLGASHVAACTTALVKATADLSGQWRKTNWADRVHTPAPFRSFADFQLRLERYLPQRTLSGRLRSRLAPHELFWPDRGIPGITPILDLGTQNRLKRAGLRPIFVERLNVNASLPSEWDTWYTWSEELLKRVRAYDPPGPKALRDFYDALLQTFRRPEGARITEVVAHLPGQDPDTIVAEAARTLWIDQGRFENPEILRGLGQLGRAILPVRLERGASAGQVLGVMPASEVLVVTPSFEPASERKTRQLEQRVVARRGALAAICATKGQKFRSVPKMRAVLDLRLGISIDGQKLADRSASVYFEGAEWLVNLQGADHWEAVATALAEPFGGHAPDLKYRFARILGARRDEIRTILAEDGIPEYRIREALLELELTEPAHRESGQGEEGRGTDGREHFPERENADGKSHEPGSDDEALNDVDDDFAEDDEIDHQDVEDEDDREGDTRDASGEDQSQTGPSGSDGESRNGKRRLKRRRLFTGGHDRNDNQNKSRRSAGEAAKAAAERGLRAEAWFMRQVAEKLGNRWQCFANVRDDQLRETDLLLKKGAEEWHLEIKCLSTERLYWSELERQKAEHNPGRYLMALLVERETGGYAVHWSWNPMTDLETCARRIEWLWEGTSEGPSLRDGWKPEAGLRWPKREASRYIHVVQVTQEHLERLPEDDGSLALLRAKIGDVGPVATMASGL